jgi:hypothetical protein
MTVPGAPRVERRTWLGRLARIAAGNYVVPELADALGAVGRRVAAGWDLRWDLDPLQPWLARHALDDARTRTLVDAALAHAAIEKVLLEPHLQTRLGLSSPKLRFQGCRAARHDDHAHLQLR